MVIADYDDGEGQDARTGRRYVDEALRNVKAQAQSQERLSTEGQYIWYFLLAFHLWEAGLDGCPSPGEEVARI